MKYLVTLCSVAALALALVWGKPPQSVARVEFGQLNLENWDQLVPQGKEVDCIYGDMVLRNEFLTAVIAEPIPTRNANMTVRTVGGALIDLTTRETPSDQLSAFYPARRKYPFSQWVVTDLAGRKLDPSGAAGEQSGVRVSVTAAAAADRPEVHVDYELQSGDRYLTVTTRYLNRGTQPLTIELEDDLRADGGKENMLKSPNGESGLFWFHDRFWGQAYGIQPVNLTVQSNSDARNSVLKYRDNGVTSVQIAPGQEYQLVRRVFPAANLVDVRAIAGENDGQAVEPVEFSLRDDLNRPLSEATVELLKGSQSLGAVNADANGVVRCRLPLGTYSFRLNHLGLSIEADDHELIVREENQPFTWKATGYRPGRVDGRIVDAAGQGIPCKIEFQAKEGSPQPDFGPETAEEGVRNLVYAAHGRFSRSIPAGEYDVIVSHGPEFDALFTTVTVEPGETVPLEGQLVRTVQTPGWVSSDFHSHSSPSGDNTGSQRGRVLNLVAEHVEFAPCTEHNRVSTYDGHIADLEIGAFMATVSGMELTGSPLPLNHQNVFPMVHRPRTQDGGGPQTDSDPSRQIERLALWDDRSEKLIQQNHPDMGWLFFDRNGDGEPDGGFERSFAFMDVVEIHPIHNVLRLEPEESISGRKGNNRIFNWLQLLNQGFRIYGVVNTDAHYNYHGSSSLRNWIQSSTDDPAEIDPIEMMHAAEQGRLVMSNGPYLETTCRIPGGKELVSGQEAEVKSGKVQLHVRVQCSNWLDVDRVIVLVNGRPHPEHSYTRESHPDLFADGVVKFDRELSLTLESDAHLVVLTGHAGRKLGPVVGPSWGSAEPAALTNPIFIDVDGGGFQPNGDTLDAPLPVKYGANKP